MNDCYNTMVLDRDAEMQQFIARSASKHTPVSFPNEKEPAFVGSTGPLWTGKTSPITSSAPLYMNKKVVKSFGSKAGKQYSRTPAVVPEGVGRARLKYIRDGRKIETLLKPGPLGMCNNPHCVECPGAYKTTQQSNEKIMMKLEKKLYNILFGDKKGCARKLVAFLNSNLPIMNPHTKIVQQWNRFFVISCFVAIFIDPLFFFLLNADRGNKCIVLNWSYATTILVVRSMTDFMYFLHMLLQFRLAYVAPESMVVGTGDLVDDPKKIALQYFRGYFILDLFVLLPLPQRVNQCLHDACSQSNISSCKSFIDCGRGNNIDRFKAIPSWNDWIGDSSSNSCFTISGDFQYGIYEMAVLLSTDYRMLRRYIYALFWGFQQISTLAGNLVPSYFELEVMFTMGIIGLGLLLFALLIGNMQNFLLALGRRRLEMQLRRRDVEKWMIHRHLPEELQRRVRQSERFTWAATRGINEEELLEQLPEDVQRDIRRHFFMFLRKVRIFALMDEPMLDVVCEKLRQKLYIHGSDILYLGGPVEKMIFIMRGKAESIEVYGMKAPLSDGDVCGEELLTWYLEHSVNKDGGKIRFPGQRLYSTRTVKCLTNVEAFALRAADLEDITKRFARFLRNARVQGVIRYESPYWRNVAAIRIQVAWRYWKRHSMRIQTPSYHCFIDPGS